MVASIIGIIVSIFCAYKCSQWAGRINRNGIAAALIGFFFGLFGLLGYYLFFKTQLKYFGRCKDCEHRIDIRKGKHCPNCGRKLNIP